MFRRILLWFAGMLLFSFVAYVGTSIAISSGQPQRGDVMWRALNFQFGEARIAFERGGAEELSAYLQRLDSQMNARHRLLDSGGRDLLSGEDRSGYISPRPEKRTRVPIPFFRGSPPTVFTRPAADGKYFFLVELPFRPDPFANLPIYLWIVLVIVLLSYALARNLATPIKRLKQTVVRFGEGDLSSRANYKRKDEVGDLARAFDAMADRIETLLTAERRLLQDVSHELRSPLARLRFALQLARSSADPKAALERVNKEVDRLATLIGELLQVTRAEGDPASRNIAPIDLKQFLGGIVEDCRIEAQARGCEIDMVVRESMLWPGDRELLHRAFENVLRNAIHHAPRESTVEVDLLGSPTHAIVRVRDYGPGVPKEQLEQIFRPFYRVEEDRSRNNGGVGLGLAIAQRAVAAHRGEIQASNADPGLVVEMRLPK